MMLMRSFRSERVQMALALAVGLAVNGVLIAQAQRRPAGWDEATHGSKVAPDYRRLFAMDRVHEIRVVMPAATFQAMQQDFSTLGPRGGRGFPAVPLPGRDGAAPNAPAGGAVAVGAVRGGRGPLGMIGREPMFVQVSVQHDGRTWTGVGMRYKGNSSLMAARRTENGKVPFRLDFDQYEDEVPETRNQRFYGFQKLTFSSNYSDDSQIREVLATEILRDRGIPAARAAFYRVYVDTGKGPEYWGLYSMVEDPADGAMLDSQFGTRQGNLYKPDGPGADWTRFESTTFEKKNNEKAADYSDVSRALDALNTPQSDAAEWRAGLESVFDVGHFLRWLAVNTVIQNWDAYGMMPHNYYLYGDPALQGRLRWIPWDHNMSFMGGRGRRGAPPPIPQPGPPRPDGTVARAQVIVFSASAAEDVLHQRVGSQFPLIQRLMADPVYSARYREELERALEGLLAAEPLERRMRELHALIAPSVIGEHAERPTYTTISSREAFEASVTGRNGLVEFMALRREMIRSVLERARQAQSNQ